MIDLDGIHRLFRLSHIVTGFAGLVLVWIPLIAAKGSRLHVRSGRWFVYCAYYVGTTGLLASIWGVLHPASFISYAGFDSLDGQRARIVAEDVRFIFSITGFLALAVMAGVTLGLRAMRAGDRPELLRSGVLTVMLAAAGLWSAGLAAYGAASLVAGYSGWHFIAPAAASRYWFNAILGVIGVYGTIGDLKFIYGPRPTRMGRWAVHMQCMIGSGAGFYAAFLLFGASRLMKLPGYWTILAPLIPLTVASFAAKRWIAAYERRFAQEWPENAEPLAETLDQSAAG